MEYYVVKYRGPFGFIKPWCAVRDGRTFSQQFLTPSIIEGIRQKLEVSAVLRHKLTYETISVQQERTQTRGWKVKKTQKLMIREQSVLERGVMINPVLTLAFPVREEAEKAEEQHVCLCRNEDLLLPDQGVEVLSEGEFDRLTGFELRFGQTAHSFLVGFNRFAGSEPMYGWLEISGKPVIGR